MAGEPKDAKSLYSQILKPSEVARLNKLLEFCHENGFYFWDCEVPKIKETSQGSNRYVEVTISIKLT